MKAAPPTVISTFAGCGGSSLGYKLAGFRELLAVEWNDAAVQTFKANFPGVPVYHGDIAELTGAECMRLAGVKAGELDVFDGSPPCQGFSTAGKRKLADPRNSLFKEYARLLAELRPRAFVMENVTGMVKGHMRGAYLTIIETLRECGYRAKGQVLNAMHYGVPQSRERVIIVGFRNDLNIEPSHPKPFSKPITIREAWAGVVNTEEDIRAASLKKSGTRVRSLAAALTPGERPSKFGVSSYFSLARARFDRPLPTICKFQSSTEVAGLLHPTELRRPTIPEIKRAASFPDDFQFPSFKAGWEQIGNCVPPLLMKAIAAHVRAALLHGGTTC